MQNSVTVGIKELIKESERTERTNHQLIYYRIDGKHYLTNAHWAIMEHRLGNIPAKYTKNGPGIFRKSGFTAYTEAENLANGKNIASYFQRYKEEDEIQAVWGKYGKEEGHVIISQEYQGVYRHLFILKPKVGEYIHMNCHYMECILGMLSPIHVCIDKNREKPVQFVHSGEVRVVLMPIFSF